MPGENDSIDVVILKNISEKNVIFKIKTTSPEKFRVRPSIGIVKPGAIEAVRLYLQSEYRHSTKMERFLLMAICTESNNTDEFGNLWKTSPEMDRFEKKLNCRIGEEACGVSTETTSHRKHRETESSNRISIENEVPISF